MALNPLVPTAYDVGCTVLTVAALVLMVVALIAWFREHRAGWRGWGELAVIVLVPVVGALAYLISRRRTHPANG